MTFLRDRAINKTVWLFEDSINDILDDMGLARGDDDEFMFGNSWEISITESYEKSVGTSFTNEAAANMAGDLVRRIYLANLAPSPDVPSSRASILIIAPYGTMAADMKTVIAAIPKHSIDHSLVDVRTVDSSMSYEADIVIILHTRTERLGFTAAAERMAVMTTRARYAQIFVTSPWEERALRGRGKLVKDFLEWHRKNHALRKTKKVTDDGWNMYCTKCYRPGHLDYICRNGFKLKCIICRGDHHVHDCPKPRPVGTKAITRGIGRLRVC